MSAGIWVEVHKYLRFCSSGVFGDQMGLQPAAPLGFVFCTCVSVYSSLSFRAKGRLWSPMWHKEIWSHTETFRGFTLFMQLFFFLSLLGPELASFQLQLLSWLKAAARDKWMCLFVAADVSLRALRRRRLEEGGRRWGHKRQAVTASVRCPPCISSHVSRAVVVAFVGECLLFQTTPLFSLAQYFFLPRISIWHVNGKEYKSCPTQSASAALE